MAYSAEKFTSVSLKTLAANLVNNNLAAAHERIVYAHSKAASTIAYGGKESERISTKIDTKDLCYVHGITVCHSSSGSAIVILTTNGLQIWNGTGAHMLLNYVHGKPEKEQPGHSAWHLSCAAATEAQSDGGAHALITAGSAAGELLLFAFDAGSGQAKHLRTEQTPMSALTALGSATDCSRGATASDILVSGDGEGELAVWKVSGEYEKVCSSSKGAAHGPVVGVAVRNQRVIAAFDSGVIQILSQDALVPEVEVYGHSRMLSGLSMHPSKDIFATVAQDSTLNVWKLPAPGTGEVGPLLSVCWVSVLITGVTFCGKSGDDVAVIGYDNEELRIYTAS